MVVAGLQIAASHQTFSSQIKHTSGQIKFGQTNFLDIANGNFMELAKENHSPCTVLVLIISAVVAFKYTAVIGIYKAFSTLYCMHINFPRYVNFKDVTNPAFSVKDHQFL